MNKPLIVSIEGNIGSGKSTFISKLEKYIQENNKEKNIFFLSEPVDEWLNIKDENDEHILSKFYNNQEKYSFTFQMMAYISRLNKLKEAIDNLKKSDNNPIIITERSLMTDKYVFAQMLYDENKIEKIEFEIYKKWFNSFNKETEIDKVIYIASKPEICYDRVKLRDRDGEENIPLDYLTKCHKYHENMIKILKDDNKDIVLLNGNDNIYKDEKVLDNWFRELKRVLNIHDGDSVNNIEKSCSL